MALHPRLIDLSLDRMWRILDALGHPERKLPPVIHVAGTNGKGSTVAFMRAILEAAGLRAHVYTSPHLVRFNERFRLGAPGAGPARLRRRARRSAGRMRAGECRRAHHGVRDHHRGGVPAVCAASRRTCCFWRSAWAGGSTRRMSWTLRSRPSSRRCRSIMPSISATTIAGIAAEKAGILKPGVPAVVAAQPREALAVIERSAARVKAPIRIAGEDWTATEERGRLVYQDDAGLLDLPAPKLFGRHQFENAGVAIAALRAAAALKLPPTAFEAGVAKADWPARMQRLSQGRAGGAGAGRERVMARRRPQRRRRARHRQCAGRSRGARLAPAGAGRGHAVDQGLRGFPAELRRAGAPRRGGADPAAGEEPARRTRSSAWRRQSASRHRRLAMSKPRSPTSDGSILPLRRES